MNRLILLLVVIIGLVAVLCWWLRYSEPAYVGPEMQTSTGGKYFCVYETEDVFQEYMMEGKQ